MRSRKNSAKQTTGESSEQQKCDKICYTKKFAQTVANEHKEAGLRRKGRHPHRAYECTICNAWHLTSKDLPPYKT